MAGKTGVFDDSIPLDFDEWLHPILMTMIQGRRGNDPLWTVSPAVIVKKFMEACGHLELLPLNPCRYALRHGGARRDLASIKKRGDWMTDASLRRYAKETRLQAEVSKIPPSTVNFGVHIRGHLPAAFARNLPYALPPIAPVEQRQQLAIANVAGRRERQRVL